MAHSMPKPPTRTLSLPAKRLAAGSTAPAARSSSRPNCASIRAAAPTASLAALGRNRAARNRQQAARVRHDMRRVERRKRTRHLIELGGLVVKARVVDLTGDDCGPIAARDHRGRAGHGWSEQGRERAHPDDERKGARDPANPSRFQIHTIGELIRHTSNPPGWTVVKTVQDGQATRIDYHSPDGELFSMVIEYVAQIVLISLAELNRSEQPEIEQQPEVRTATRFARMIGLS